MVAAPTAIPQAKSAAPAAEQVRQEFNALKRQLNEVPEWSLTHPTEPDKIIELRVVAQASEQLARIFGKAHTP